MQTVRKITTLASFAAFQFPICHLFFSPVLSVAGAAAGVVSGSLAVYATLALSSLVFGRAFCGWLCPGTALHECCLIAGAKRTSGQGYWTKYVLSAVWLCVVAAAALRGGGFRRVDLLFGTGSGDAGPARAYLLSFGAPLIVGSLSFLIGRFALCHYGCWIGALMVFGSRIKERFGWPSLRLRADAGQCAGCDECVDACPMSLPVRDMVVSGALANDECILCGRCVSGCPTAAIELGFMRPGARAE